MDTNTKKPIFKQWWFWLIAVIVLGFLIQTFASKETKQKWASEDSTKKEKTQSNLADSSKSEPLKEQEKIQSDKVILKKVLFEKLFAEPFNTSEYRGSMENTLKEAFFFAKCYDAIVEEAGSEQAEKARKRLITLQTSEFPKMRKEYCKQAADKLWKENMEVVGSGSGTNSITLIAGAFASNKSVSDYHEGLREILRDLRFQRDTYEWYKGSEGTYWDLKNPKDAELIPYSQIK